MKRELSDGAVLGAPVCVEDGVYEALLVIDMKRFDDPKYKFFAETIEPGERPIDTLKRGMKEELGIDPGKIAGIQFEEMAKVPIGRTGGKILHQYCIKLPRAVIHERHEQFVRGPEDEEHHYLRKFPLREVGELKSFLPEQQSAYQTLLKHLRVLEPAH